MGKDAFGNYVVEITGRSVVVIDAEDEDEAITFALHELHLGDFDIEDFGVREITPAEDIESLKRCANNVMAP